MKSQIWYTQFRPNSGTELHQQSEAPAEVLGRTEVVSKLPARALKTTLYLIETEETGTDGNGTLESGTSLKQQLFAHAHRGQFATAPAPTLAGWAACAAPLQISQTLNKIVNAVFNW